MSIACPLPFARWKSGLAGWLLLLAPAALADSTNTLTLRTDLPDAGLSALRTLAALVIVLALFFGGVWLYRSSQRLAWRKGGSPKLAVLESRALGSRFAIYVVGYEQQRFLVGSSPAGLNLLSPLPEAAATAPAEAEKPAEPAPFARCLQHLLKGRFGGRTEGTGS
jgi:flagellar biogenesis protein FliO